MVLFVLSRLVRCGGALAAMATLGFAMLTLSGDAPIRPPQELVIAFGSFLRGIVTGELGESAVHGGSVSALLQRHAPSTLRLLGVAALGAVSVGTLLGLAMLAARTPGRVVATAAGLIAILPVLLLALALRIIADAPAPDGVPVWWPALALAIVPAAAILVSVHRLGRSVLNSAHIQFARARGLGEAAILGRHAPRALRGQIVQLAGAQLALLPVAAIVVETVFDRPGLGSLFAEALQAGDVPVMIAGLLVLSAAMVLVRLVGDIAGAAFDPRLRRADAA